MTTNNQPVSFTRRTLAMWALLMIVSVGGVVAFAAGGDGVIRSVEAQRLLGRAEDLLRAHRLDEAIVLLTRAVQTRTDDLPARRLLVKSLLRAGRFAEAAAQAQAGTEQVRQEDLQEARGLLDEVRREMGHEDTAAEFDSGGAAGGMTR